LAIATSVSFCQVTLFLSLRSALTDHITTVRL
jgi:hypothetical protein